jgi:undecaprenyl-diphosphatase
MDWLHSIILGLIEGITEFLPISSTGHLILASHFLHLDKAVADSFEVFIQLGAILAVLVLYTSRFTGLLKVKAGNAFSGGPGFFKLMITSLPALVLAYLFRDTIKSVLFGPDPVIWAMGVVGFVLIFIDTLPFKHHTHSLNKLTYKQAALIGLFQCASLWPGTSRSASTIIGGLLAGLDRKTAAEYSFIAAVPIMICASGYELLKEFKHLNTDVLGLFALGFLVSFGVAYFAIQVFVKLVQRSTFRPFGLYRVGFALAYVFYLRHYFV